MDTMSERLMAARIGAGYTSAAKAAEAIGVPASTYRCHENGQNNFDIDEAKRYSRRFKVTPSWLLFGEGDFPGGVRYDNQNQEEASVGERLKEARFNAGFKTAIDAALALGVGQSAYSAHESSRNQLRFDTAKKYADRFGVSVSWLMTGDDKALSTAKGDEYSDMETVFSIPIDGIPELDLFAGMGGGGVIQEVVTTVNGQTMAAEAIADYWRVPDGFLAAMHMRPSQLIAIPLKGDSNEPTLRSSDIAFIDIRHKHPSPDGFYALADLFGEVIVKRVTRISPLSDPEPKFEISSDNPKHPSRTETGEDLRIIGRVAFRVTQI